MLVVLLLVDIVIENIMSVGGKQSSLRKAIGAIKDTTTVSLAKVHSGYKELDINIVKATNHVERPAKEKHIRAIFAYISATRPRADVAYCIYALAKRLSRTRNWAVALKTLIVIHRALREVDQTFQEELINFIKFKGHMLNMAHFKDDSGPHAWDYSAWVRNYALFIEERLECFRVLKYDVEAERPRTKDLDTPDMLDQLPALQQLLFRIVSCQPQGAAVHNFVIKTALSLVASESIRVYNAIKDGLINLVDKFFEMKRHDAQKAFDIYRRAGKQAERLAEFYELCTRLDVGRGERYATVEQPPGSFLQAMEEYVRDAPRASTLRKDLKALEAPKVILSIDYKKTHEKEEKRPPSPSPPPPEPVKVEAPVQTPDLLGLNDPAPAASGFDEKNASALAIVPVDNQSATSGPDSANGGTGWELALVPTPNSKDSAAASSKMAGGMNKFLLDTLYDDAIKRSNQNVSYNPWEQQSSLANPTAAQTYDPFYASNTLAAASTVQMAAMASQQQAFMLQQQQMMMMMNPQQQPFNPFGNPYGAAASAVLPYGSGMPVQASNAYTGLI
ncbi:putative clathrin assembly protein At5g35200 isoform X1 [Daucus carota subsp. sativus]|nr:PREDICTED: putative clathrin assembly protein At5g35200 isoform X1 [Daucus carota subsp. sativus]